MLDDLIGKRVRITMVDKVITGELHRTSEKQFKDILEIYLKPNYYFLTEPQSCLFRKSHVKKVEVLLNE